MECINLIHEIDKTLIISSPQILYIALVFVNIKA